MSNILELKQVSLMAVFLSLTIHKATGTGITISKTSINYHDNLLYLSFIPKSDLSLKKIYLIIDLPAATNKLEDLISRRKEVFDIIHSPV
jgi:hypothetical protein